MNEELKKESIKIYEQSEKMSMPCITITPMFTIEDTKWRKILYILLGIKEEIERQIGSPLVINMLDKNHGGNDDQQMGVDKNIPF